ncbi:DUF6269 family protein [Streptomyces netropsis]
MAGVLRGNVSRHGHGRGGRQFKFSYGRARRPVRAEPDDIPDRRQEEDIKHHPLETSQVEDPLDFMDRVADMSAADQELMLRQSGIPWPDLLAAYADRLTEQVARGPENTGPAPR